MVGCFVAPTLIDCEVDDHPACASNETDTDGPVDGVGPGSATSPTTTINPMGPTSGSTGEGSTSGEDASSTGSASASGTDAESGSESGSGTIGETETGSDTNEIVELGPCNVPFSSLTPDLEGDGANGTVSNDRFSARFDPARGGTLSRLELDGGPNLMAEFNAATAEVLSGVLAYNPTTDTVDAATSWLTGSVTVIESGPVLVRVLVDYGGQTSTVYTVHPDGRVLRDEQWHQTTELGGSYLLTFLALDNAELDRLRWTGQEPSDTAIPSATGSHNVLRDDASWEEGFSCAYRDRTDLGFVGVANYETTHEFWPQAPADRITVPASGVGSDRITLQADWVDSDLVSTGIYYAQSMIVVGEDEPDAERCACLEAQQQIYTSPPELDLTGANPVFSNMPSDYDGDGFDEGMGVYGIDPADGATTIDIELPSASAPTLALKIFHTTNISGVELDGVALTEDEMWGQQVAGSGNEVFIYVSTGIPAGASLRVVL